MLHKNLRYNQSAYRWDQRSLQTLKANMKKQIAIFLAVLAIALGAQAQTTVGVTSSNTLVQGSNAQVKGQYVTIDAASAIILQSPSITTSGAINATGNLTVRGYTTLSGPNTTIGSGNSVTELKGYNTTVTSSYTNLNSTQTFINGEKTVFNEQGTITTINKNGVSTAGSVTAADVYTGGMNVGNEIINLKNSVTGKASANDAINLTNTVTANKAALDAEVVRATGVEAGLQSTKADKTAVASEITRVDGRIDATNTSVTNLTTAVNNNATTAANATAAVQANLNTEVTTRTNEVARVDGRIDVTTAALATEKNRATTAEALLDNRKADKVAVAAAITAEENARIAGDVATLNAANHYTDSKSGADRAYTDKSVAAESNRAQAAEAALSKETKQVGAMAMAATGVAGATPVGDKQTAVTAAVGAYSGQTAIAVGVTRLVKDNAKIFGAFSKVSGGKTGVTVGASFSF